MSNTQTVTIVPTTSDGAPMSPMPLANGNGAAVSGPNGITPIDSQLAQTASNGNPTTPTLEKSESFAVIKRLTDKARTFTQTFLPEPPRRAATIRAVEDFELGYPRAAGFIASDEDFQVYRRYTYLHTRLLLHKQLEIRLLEKKLEELDSRKDPKNQRHLRNYGREYHIHNHTNTEAQETSERIQLMEKLDPLLNSYDELLFKTQQILAMKSPSKTARNSVFSYLTTRTTLVQDETQYIDHKLDLVSLAPGIEKAWVDDFVAGLLRFIGKVPHTDRIFCSAEDRMKAKDPIIRYSTRWRVNLFVAFLITVLIVILLVAPVYGLFKITSREGLSMNDKVNASIAVLIGATFVMALMLSMFTRARRHESLAASAA